MKLVLKLKLNTDTATHMLLQQTSEIYLLACNRLSTFAFEHQVFSKYELQKQAYHALKAELSRPSQLLIRAIADVCAAYKTLRTQIKAHNQTCCPQERRNLERIEFHPGLAVPYDQRVLSVDRSRQRLS